MILSTLIALAAIADAPLPPSGNWNIDYGSSMCVASRMFGSGPSSVRLAIRPPSFSMKRIEVTLLLPADSPGVDTGGGTLTLGASGNRSRLEYVSAGDAARPRGYKTLLVDGAASLLGDASSLVVQTSKGSQTLATGNLKPAIAALATCNADLLRNWGADPTAMAEPLGNPGEWFTDDDYPSNASKRRAQGATTILLTISPDGKVAGCTVVKTSGDPDLDRASCENARGKARFASSRNSGPRFMAVTARWIIRAPA